jgi:hypothetical protein
LYIQKRMKMKCMIQDLKKLNKKLQQLEKELSKVRGANPLDDGWQTQRLAKKQRKWDMLAIDKNKIRAEIDRIEIELIGKEVQWFRDIHDSEPELGTILKIQKPYFIVVLNDDVLPERKCLIDNCNVKY